MKVYRVTGHGRKELWVSIMFLTGSLEHVFCVGHVGGNLGTQSLRIKREDISEITNLHGGLTFYPDLTEGCSQL